MKTVTVTEILRKPSLLKGRDVLILEDGRKRQPKSVIMPYKMYERIQQKVAEEEKLEKLRRIKRSTEDTEFLEAGVDDGDL